jgi:1-acyl-sn-glycerol-3-phosphate acyltransferase
MIASLRGMLVTAIFSITIIMVTLPIVFFALLRLIPIPAWQHLLNPCLDASANFWIRVNNVQQRWLLPTHLDVGGMGELSREEWYMLVANHQAWADILIIVRTFGTKIPGVKFFFKRSLLWVPVLGLALWGLDFPSMRRHSKAEIARDPSLKGKDLERTRKACARFRHHPVTIINFLEGTRFTKQKHQQQASIYRHLLMPKAGGLAFALGAMDGQLHHLLDVTIYYEGGIPSYWSYVCGKVKRIRVQVRQLPIPAGLLGDYEGDPAFRARFQQWVNDLWQHKDEMIEELAQGRQKIN